MAEVATQAVSAAGFKFEVAVDSGSGTAPTLPYLELGEIREDDLDLPEDSRVVIAFRTNRSPGKYTERVLGPKDLGETTVSMNFVVGNPGHVILENAFTNGTLLWFKFTNGVGNYATVYKGYVSKRPKMFKGADTDRVTYTLSPSGGPQSGSTFN